MALWLASGAMVRVKGEAVVPSSGASTIAVALLTELDGLVMSIALNHARSRALAS